MSNLQQVHSRYVGTGHSQISQQYVRREFFCCCNDSAAIPTPTILTVSFYFNFHYCTAHLCLPLLPCCCSEWATGQHRDSIASYLGHDSIIDYFAMAEGISSGRAKLNLLERMHAPCGPPPKKQTMNKGQTSK